MLSPPLAQCLLPLHLDTFHTGWVLRGHRSVVLGHLLCALRTHRTMLSGIFIPMVMPVAVYIMMFAMVLPSSSSLRGLRALLPVFLIAGGLPSVNGVCTHCKDTIVGCTGGDNCPLVKDLAANVAGFQAGTLTSVPNLLHLMPARLRASFPRAVLVRFAHTAQCCLGFSYPWSCRWRSIL